MEFGPYSDCCGIGVYCQVYNAGPVRFVLIGPVLFLARSSSRLRLRRV